MTVLMHDAKQDLQVIHGVDLSSSLLCHDILYADDTLLIDVVSDKLQSYMQCVVDQGRSYGLKLN